MASKWRRVHSCSVGVSDDVVQRLYSGASCLGRLHRWVRRQCTVSANNAHSKKYLRSEAYLEYERLRHLSTFPNVIHPFSNFRTIWELFMIVILTVSLFLIPFHLTFMVNVEVIVHVNFFLSVACLCDVIVNFSTGCFNYATKEICLEPRVISWRYIKGYFAWDLLSSIPVTYFLWLFNVKKAFKVLIFVDMVSSLKLVRIPTLLRYVRHVLEAFKLRPWAGITVRAALVSAIVLQWASCLLFLVAKICQNENMGTPEYNKSWIIATHLKQEGWFRRYQYSVFYGTSLLLRVDYGHATPRTFEDLVMVILVTLVALIMYMWIVGEVLLLVCMSDAACAKYEEMLQQLTEYMYHKQLTPKIRNRLLTYYEYRFQRSYFHETNILASLTGQLRQDIILHSCRRLVENVEFFRDLPVDLLVSIVQCLRSEIYLPKDVIVQEGLEGECMYFLATGTVAVYSPSGKELAHLADGAHFGEIAILEEGSRRTASVVAVEICQVYWLHRDDYRRAITPYPDLVKRIETTAAERRTRTMSVDRNIRSDESL